MKLCRGSERAIEAAKPRLRSPSPANEAHCQLYSTQTSIDSIRGLSKQGWLYEALISAETMQQQEIPLSRGHAHCLLRECMKQPDLETCRRVHWLIGQSKLESIEVLANHLVRLFGMCGSLAEANEAFSKVEKPTEYTWTAIITAHVKHGQGKTALDFYRRMLVSGVKSNTYAYVAALQSCTLTSDLNQGREIHKWIIENQLGTDSYVGSTLIDMYAKCGSLNEAQNVFNHIPNANLVSIGAMISGYAHHGQGHQALECFDNMQENGLNPERIIFLSILKACGKVGAIERGRRIHDKIVESGLEFDISLGNTLLDMYAKCGSLEEAQKVFNQLPTRNLISYNAMVAGHAQNGNGLLALACFGAMQHEGIQPDKFTFSSILKALNTMELGRFIHVQIRENGLETDAFVGSTLVDMYARFGSLEEARHIFDHMANRDIISWGAIIAGYIQHGKCCAALQCFDEMQCEGLEPNEVILLSLVKACASIGTLGHGRYFHEQIIDSGLQCNIFLGNTLVDMYIKCGSLEEAHAGFYKLANRDIVVWSAMVAGYVHQGKELFALECIDQMEHDSIKPEKATFFSILQACANLEIVEHGRRIHEWIIEGSLQSDVFIGSALIDMYGACGSLEESHRVFDKLAVKDVALWSAMVKSYIQNDESFLAIECFDGMQQDGIMPDKGAYLSILKACGSISCMERGRYIHQQIMERGLHYDLFLGNMLIDMYGKCGSLKEACQLFDILPNRDIVSWNAMIGGFAEHGEGLLGLDYYKKMQQDGLQPNEKTFAIILKACGSIGAVEQGQQIYEQVIKNGLQSDIFIETTLVDMYAKCGKLEEACSVFDKLQNRNVVSWNAMIAGYAECGQFELAKRLFKTMQQGGIKPDNVTYVILLSACSHAGLVDEGCEYFRSLLEDHGCMPNACHYACMVDLLGSTGRLNDAENLLQSIEPDIIGWTSLLSACRKYSNVELGRRCFNIIVQLDPQYASAYMLMSSIYSNAGMWKEAEKLEDIRCRFGAWKKPAKAWIEIDNKVHEFIVGDKEHPQAKEIYEMLKILSSKMKQAGYKPKVDLVLQNMSEKDKEDALCGHCEKLAVAYALVSTPPGTAVRATKNLRMCMDCHTATEFISKMEKRDIVIKDAHCTHHFKDGSCSCGSYYW